MNGLPILSTIPRSGTWFLRYAISFLCHLERGGQVRDRITGAIVGNRGGPEFDLRDFKGGPLFRVRGVIGADHLFVGHTVCPGFDGGNGGLPWWPRLGFHVPGYDYLHEGKNYHYTRIELSPYEYTPLRVASLERAARRGRGGRIALVYRNPIDQALSYFRYCQSHVDPAYHSMRGRPLKEMSFEEYLFQYALPSYAKQFISYQVMAARHPRLVKLVTYERMIAAPVETLSGLLDHLEARMRFRPWLVDAVQLARAEHLKAVERETGHSLDGTRIARQSHIRSPGQERGSGEVDPHLQAEADGMLRQLGVRTDLIDWPAVDRRRTAVAA